MRTSNEGEPGLAQALERALLVAREDRGGVDDLTHPFHTYPARMHPATARALVRLVAGGAGAGPKPTIVDPFCGPGTTLVEARAAGLPAIGIDLNPLAASLARSKTWASSAQRRAKLVDRARAIAGAVLAAGKAARRGGFDAPPWRGPPGVNAAARNKAIARWFAPHVRRELEAIASAIDEVAPYDGEVGEILRMALSAILYKVSSRASDTDPEWVERSIARGAPARLFVQRVENLARGLARMDGAPVTRVVVGDARQAGTLVDPSWRTATMGVVTSPPYAGTYDYAEHHGLRLAFLGMPAKPFARGELGARRHLRGDAASDEARWLDELGAALAAIAAVTTPGALAAIVIGDSLAGRTPRFARDDVRAALPAELDWAASASASRPLLGVDERSGFAARGKFEHAILLRRRPTP